MIANHKVYRILVDTGSSADILYSVAFNKMGINRSSLRPIKTPLHGFTSDKVILEGAISLPVTTREGQNQITLLVDFLVVNAPLTHNVIIGQPSLNTMRAVVSTYHLMMKFLVVGRVGYVRGDQREARQCYSITVSKGSAKQAFTIDMLDPRENILVESSPMEDLLTFPLDGVNPTRTVQLRSSLSAEQWDQMLNFLRQHKDVFAWSHQDMSGIASEVMVHKLNVDLEHKLVMQKRRAFELDRYATIAEEVAKLVDIGFIEEVHYPNWIANVVLVKKANGKWRVCIDYSNLNKACPKDGFPISRIDQLINSTAGHELLTFMDAYFGYSQIAMHSSDKCTPRINIKWLSSQIRDSTTAGSCHSS
ncbi:uncharacterized protein LOC131228782 [Magnolia sinica]|uniref:uncharacterized protein LOC131228782 n=1 Tax=Magnolia sinica TaxID=86752 RepID=UPI002658F4E4|nr:uncharacterized protein LOC131228782 [Magnolia sinica]